MKFITLTLFGALVGGAVMFTILTAKDTRTVSTESEVGATPSTSESEPTDNQETLPSFGSVEVYDGVRISKDATELDLSGRGLTGSLKAEVRQLSKLQVVDLSNNQFTGLPAEVGQLVELRVLNLANNPFTGLPHELGNLQKLETLDLRGTNYAAYDLEIIRSRLPQGAKVLVD